MRLALDACEVDLLLAGHLHHGYSGDTRTQYPASHRAIISAQAGTAISGRARRTMGPSILRRDAVRAGSAPPRRAMPRSPPGRPTRGASLYRTCATCHGADGQGIQATNAPRLAGMSDWYLVRQLRNFRQDIRGRHADDLYGWQMAEMARILADKGLHDKAAAEIEIALGLDAESYEVNRSAGYFSFRRQQLPDAIRFFEKAMALVETDVNSACMLLTCYTAIGNSQSTRRAAQLALTRTEAALAHDAGALLDGIQARLQPGHQRLVVQRRRSQLVDQQAHLLQRLAGAFRLLDIDDAFACAEGCAQRLARPVEQRLVRCNVEEIVAQGARRHDERRQP